MIPKKNCAFKPLSEYQCSIVQHASKDIGTNSRLDSTLTLNCISPFNTHALLFLAESFQLVLQARAEFPSHTPTGSLHLTHQILHTVLSLRDDGRDTSRNTSLEIRAYRSHRFDLQLLPAAGSAMRLIATRLVAVTMRLISMLFDFRSLLGRRMIGVWCEGAAGRI